jgi:hypothetical protein
MLVAGRRHLCDDGATRPLLRANVAGAHGRAVAEDLLIDSGADRTVLSATCLSRLGLPTEAAPSGLALSGIGGRSDFVLLHTALEFVRTDGGALRVRGQFACFTESTATDFSVLGRDVLDLFDLIISHRGTRFS